mmetsp:Transcript_2850/g.6036  ORF Transcript_2850/g.6036 Transcript_2850/m.6036 type:complete len:361 (-) Transcript_2850:150-1232(-)|eukprot:CAMPEP_0172532710 /NCGR_PEP_ID=MMETSP1067-20121228/5663_1 /TAXON_ID=265564 ORGANISM="Thalassiosira punctigera, Strain Tpunct2005C2" /NCGR_SAMPLE_ID=MMETSP1067 /ASSEMBLY_ACC=CAM_ASM_000444 /LENGTH=360 /DNA_ID=CAMNT_0013317259 /DNA_START=80 /DNA_END=1162 /DNA_ORIENTATION=-
MKNQTKAKASRTNPAIKGYLSIRVALPPITLCGNEKLSFTSFIYVKEHAQRASKGSGGDSSGGGGATLFVANAPANGPVRTDLFLRALFERYGEVQRVTVTKDPRKVSTSSAGEEAAETFREAALAGIDDGLFAAKGGGRGDGKFAHVVFSSGKEMRKALKAMKRDVSEADDGSAIRLDDDRMDQLEAETARLLAEESHQSDDDESKDQNEGESGKSLTGIHAIAAQARQKAYRHISRKKLMDMCNEAMASYETEEAEAERRAKLAAEQPDEDGFITVTHGSTPSFGATNDLEEERHGRRKGGKRNRKRKGVSGADEHMDFYRFQMKETRKKEAVDLKKRFEEDLAKVKKMKEERAYRPF